MTRFHIVLEAPNVSAAVRIIIGPLAVLFIIFEVAYIFMAGQIRLGTPGQSPFSNHHVIAEIPHVYAAVCIGVGTLTVLLVVLERADVSITHQCRLGAPGLRTLAGFHIIREVPNINAAVCIGVSALTVLLVVFESADVFITSQCCLGAPGFRTQACFHIIREVPNIYAAVCIGVSTLTVLLVVLERADIFITRQCRLGAPGLRTLPGFHIIREVPNIYAAVCIGVSALTVLLVVSEVTDVFITSQCCLKPPSYGALACPYITFEFASVSGSVGLGVSTLAVFFVIGKVTDIFIAGQSRL